ncbi:hypothetical protein [Amycolatopsis sp. NBC_00345]|uniref:hypothetical protein n=1 Tax=Amycolatopsis sp. NBC_00345 TaxID=2975955 RepID=UPI003FA429F6
MNSYGSLARLDLAGETFLVHRLDAVPGSEHLPLSHKILLENLLRHEDGRTVTAGQIASLVRGRVAGVTDVRRRILAVTRVSPRHQRSPGADGPRRAA